MTADDKDDGSPTLAEIVGHNAKRLRADHNTEALAKCAKQVGLRWNTGRVTDLEAGRISPTVPTLLALTFAFGGLLGRPVALTELFEAEGFVKLNDDFPAVRADLVLEALGGQPIGLKVGHLRGGKQQTIAAFKKSHAAWKELPTRPDDPDTLDIQTALKESGPTEDRVARDLGISTLRLAYESARLWKGTFTQERDRRAGDDANAQKRGRVSRDMKHELRQAISDDQKAQA
ncbi:hypothetical protein FOH10_30430 [Nocardia otitidiscaviarum]|uniref:Uncharacterized protein n=1 Tax=Nocardia otitidiscaviarum TaxID=1823 RepID=A0A516NU12_9NOCA|nr:hypothetical protein [Nocardia otitidiscaviarum]MCP9621771.1 hypothetical protein [Nocardia otitidiscaviarum]QDP82407.1 hypothetical protein FOH10_30430 [Nocardia otitidiscaviarum]